MSGATATAVRPVASKAGGRAGQKVPEGRGPARQSKPQLVSAQPACSTCKEPGPFAGRGPLAEAGTSDPLLKQGNGAARCPHCGGQSGGAGTHEAAAGPRIPGPQHPAERAARRASEGCGCPACQARANMTQEAPGDMRPGAGVGARMAGLRNSGGRPLGETLRANMEPKIGRDLGEVRLHTGRKAQEAAGALGAEAFSQGNHVGFAEGAFRPGTPAGDKLLMHELTHAAQAQDAGLARDPNAPVMRSPGPQGPTEDPGAAGIGIGSEGLIITLPDQSLCTPFQKELGSLGPYGIYYPLWTAGAPIGPIVVAGSVGLLGFVEGSIQAFFGPCVLRGIRLTLNPFTSRYTGTAQLYVAAGIAPRFSLFGGVAALGGIGIPTTPPIILTGAVFGGLRGTGTLWGLGALQATVQVVYDSGRLSLDATGDLMAGLLAQGDLDLFAAAYLMGYEVCRYVHPISHWESGTAWKISVPVHAGIGGGSPPAWSVGPATHGPIPITDIENAIRPLPSGWECKGWDEIKAILCKAGVLPDWLCDDDEDGGEIEPLKKYLARARCKCVGDDACGGGKYYDICFYTNKATCEHDGNLRNAATKVCNSADLGDRCKRPKCYFRHSGSKCPVKDSECDEYANSGGGESSTCTPQVPPFPTFAEIVADGTISGAASGAWSSTLAATTPTGRREQGFWIRFDNTSCSFAATNHFTGPTVGPGDGAGANPGTKPADTTTAFTVGLFHTHTPTTFRTVGRPVGPSGADETFHNSNNVAGLVYDYTAVSGGNIPAGHPLNSAAQIYASGPNRRA